MAIPKYLQIEATQKKFEDTPASGNCECAYCVSKLHPQECACYHCGVLKNPAVYHRCNECGMLVLEGSSIEHSLSEGHMLNCTSKHIG